VKRYEDDVLPGADSAFAFDELSRLTQVQESTWNSSTITTKTCQEDWTLDQFRNWLTYKKDSDGDGAYSTAKVNDIFDDGVFDIANKYTKRVDKKPTPSVDKNMAYTPTGALTNDGKAYKDMKYDAWGRLVEVRNQSSLVQAVYRYNGVGHRITWHDDADNDADVDGSDPAYHLAVTEGGSMLAVYRGSDANVKEQIYLHLRGLNGWPSVKCDGETEVIVVDADRSTAWSAAADTVTETRSYLLTNQRGDVVTVISDAGRVRERPRYSAYGVPMLIMRTDWDADGDVDSSTGAGTDQAAYEADYFAGSPPARADYNFDGNIDPDDLSDYIADRTADAGGGYGYGRLSSAGVGNRKGFASAEHERVYSQVVVSRRGAFARTEIGRHQGGFVYLRATQRRGSGVRWRADVVIPGLFPDPFLIPLTPITITPPSVCPPRDEPVPPPVLPDLLPSIPEPPRWPCSPGIDCPAWSPFAEPPPDPQIPPGILDGFLVPGWVYPGFEEPYDPSEGLSPIGRFYYWWYETMPWTSTRELAEMSDTELVCTAALDAATIAPIGSWCLSCCLKPRLAVGWMGCGVEGNSTWFCFNNGSGWSAWTAHRGRIAFPSSVTPRWRMPIPLRFPERVLPPGNVPPLGPNCFWDMVRQAWRCF